MASTSACCSVSLGRFCGAGACPGGFCIGGACAMPLCAPITAKIVRNTKVLWILRSISFLPAVNQKVCGGDDENGENYRRGQAADNGAGHGGILFAALAQLHRHRKHADNGREGGHQNRPKPHAASRNYSVGYRQTLVF